jgi:hypothetical protein
MDFVLQKIGGNRARSAVGFWSPFAIFFKTTSTPSTF